MNKTELNRSWSGVLILIGSFLIALLLLLSYQLGNSREYYEKEPPQGYKWHDVMNQYQVGEVILVPTHLKLGDSVIFNQANGTKTTYILIN